MRDDKLINAPERKITDGWRNRWASSIILTITFIVALAAMLSIFTGNEQNYTPVTITCISCHNDTGYPNDTSLDGRFAPYERPHNNTVWCEYCHLKNPHTIVFIQPNGSYSARSTAASCPECHQAGVPNPNFTSAPRITSPLRHSSNILNGSVWGNYWMNTEPKTACMYCHGNTLHNTTPFGRILAWSPAYQKYRPIGANFTCADCHYKGDANWSQMNLTFTSAGLKIPPEITNGTTWKGFPGYFNHTLDNYTDGSCRQCHGLLLSTNASMSEFIHNVDAGSLEACTSCHSAVSSPDLGMHSTLNGTSGVDNGDCKTCHYGTIQMVKGGANTSNTYYCADCHTSGGTGPKKSNITFTDKIHGEATCTDCHVADGTYHQDSPRGAVANSTYVSRYTPGNTTVVDCADCHYARNLDDAPFNAPGGGNHIINNGGACADGGCHHLGGSSMVETVHSLNPQDWGFKPSITVPSLSASTVMKGTNVTVNATITAGGDYDSVDGAHYRIMSGAVEIVPWTPMSAEDGDFGGTSDVATATINTSALGGAYTVEVRGMAGGPSQNPALRYYPVNGDVSAVQSSTLNVTLSLGHINGIVTNGSAPLAGALVSTADASTTTTSDGTYSLSETGGMYNVTASKQPQYYDSTTTAVEVTPDNTTVRNFSLTLKPTGTISGKVKNASSGVGIGGAWVKLVQYPEYNATTLADGSYTMLNVPYGLYRISAAANTYTKNVSISNITGATVTNFSLSEGSITGDYRYYAMVDNEIASNKLSVLSDIGKNFTIPQYGDGGAWHTQVYVTDASGLGTNLTLNYYDSGGNLVVTENPILPANGTYKWIPSDGTNGRPTTGKLVITSNRSVVGEYKIYSTSNTDMISSKLYTTNDTGTNFTIPQYGDHTSWDTWIAISDVSGKGVNLTLKYYDTNGNLVVTENEKIPANGMYTNITSSGINGRPTTGKLEITSNNTITGEYRIFSLGSGGILANKLYTDADKSKMFIIPQYGDHTAWDTWIAISDAAGIGATLTMEYYYPNGTLAVVENANVPPNGAYTNITSSGINGRPTTGKLVISSDNLVSGEIRIYSLSGRGIMANSLFAQRDIDRKLIVPYYGNNINFGTYLSLGDVSGIDASIRVEYHYLNGTLAKTESPTITADGLLGWVVSDGTSGRPTEGNMFIYT